MRLSDQGKNILKMGKPVREGNNSGLLGATDYYRFPIEVLKAGNAALKIEVMNRGEVSSRNIPYHVLQWYIWTVNYYTFIQ